MVRLDISIVVKNVTNNIEKWLQIPNFYYLLGLIATDGNLVTQTKICGYAVSIIQHKRELQLLLKIKKLFGGTINKVTDTCLRWRINNKFFYQFLTSVGITPKKSHTLTINQNFWQNISLENKQHFMRGVIDGDGYIMTLARQFGITSFSQNFRKLLLDFFQQYSEHAYEVDKPKSKYVIVTITKNFVNNLPTLFTANKEFLFMYRKFKRFEKICWKIENVRYNKNARKKINLKGQLVP